MLARHQAEIGPARGQNSIGFVAADEVTADEHGDPRLIANEVREPRLPGAAARRIGSKDSMAAGDVKKVTTGVMEGARHGDCLFLARSALMPVGHRVAQEE